MRRFCFITCAVAEMGAMMAPLDCDPWCCRLLDDPKCSIPCRKNEAWRARIALVMYMDKAQRIPLEYGHANEFVSIKCSGTSSPTIQ